MKAKAEVKRLAAEELDKLAQRSDDVLIEMINGGEKDYWRLQKTAVAVVKGVWVTTPETEAQATRLLKLSVANGRPTSVASAFRSTGADELKKYDLEAVGLRAKATGGKHGKKTVQIFQSNAASNPRIEPIEPSEVQSETDTLA